MSKIRLLIPITLQFGIRYFLRSQLLQYLSQFITPVIFMAWHDTQLNDEFSQLGAEVYPLPRQVWGNQYQRTRKRIDIWHQERVQSPSVAIDERRLYIDAPLPTFIIRRLRVLAAKSNLILPGAEKRVLAEEKELLLRDTNFTEYQKLLDNVHPDAVFSLAPFHRDEEMLVRAAQEKGLPLCTAIHSFDNLTTRGWIPAVFDTYLLWNRYNAAELARIYPETSQKNVAIVGTPQFDFYWDPTYRWGEATWRQALNLPPERPVILFGGGPASIVPHEPHFLLQLDQAIQSGEIPGNPLILFRRHPVDSMERWEYALRQTRNVVADTPWQDGPSSMHFNITRSDLERLVSTLYYSQVHVNTSSTMTVDGAIFDRPQVGPAYDDRPGHRYDRISRELYLREHYLPITNSGGLSVAYSRDELVAAVRDGLLNPSYQQQGRKKIVAEICTFADGKCMQRVASALEQFVNSRMALKFANKS